MCVMRRRLHEQYISVCVCVCIIFFLLVCVCVCCVRVVCKRHARPPKEMQSIWNEIISWALESHTLFPLLFVCPLSALGVLRARLMYIQIYIYGVVVFGRFFFVFFCILVWG